MNSELHKLGYEHTLQALGLELEKDAARAGMLGKFLSRFRKPKLPGAQASQAAAQEIGTTQAALSRGRSLQVPAAPPPKPLDPVAMPSAPPAAGQPGYRHPSTFFGGPKGTMAPPPSARAPRTTPAGTDVVPTAPGAAAEEAPGLLSRIPTWGKAGLGLGAGGLGAYALLGGRGEPEVPLQYYGAQETPYLM